MADNVGKRFCFTCGALMGKKQSISSYSEKTGKASYRIKFYCPNNRFYKPGHSSCTIYTDPDYNRVYTQE